MDHFLSMNVKVPDDSTIRFDPNNETVNFWKGRNLSRSLDNDPVFAELRSKALFSSMALAFLSAHHEVFKLQDPFQELAPASASADDLGYIHVKFQQRFLSIPVLNAEIIVHLNPTHQVNLVNGRYIPTPLGLDTEPALSAQEAARRAAEYHADSAPEISDAAAEHVIYAPDGSNPRLAWQVPAHSDRVKGSKIFIIDARTGELLTTVASVYDESH